jgi:hypothetical protein
MKIRRIRIGLLLVSAAIALLPAEEAVNPPAARFSIAPATSRITIDGVLDEKEWKECQVIPLPTEWTPGDNVPAPVATECRVTYDRHNLYVSFRCLDPEPGNIRAHLMDRDAIDSFVQDDYVAFSLDTFNDERRSFQFRLNPLGVQADAFFSEQDGYEDFSWDAIWASAARIDATGWTAEIAIPFQQLRFRDTDALQSWGFSAERSWPRGDRHRMESHPRDRNRNCYQCQFNKISGLIGISPGRNIEIAPTLTLQRSDENIDFPDVGLIRGKMETEPGLTATWGMTSNLILNAAVNPDFSQVEADTAQLDVNTRYALYYAEKRPFFLEGNDFFLTPMQAVFTRTVADPVWGVKLSGKVGGNAIGFFAAQDRINNLIVPSNQGSDLAFLEDDVFSGVFRYRRDIGHSSSLGALYAGRTGTCYHNHVGGVDGFFRLGQNDQLRFQYLRSDTRYPDDLADGYGQQRGTFGGGALYAEYSHQTRNLNIYGSYNSLGAGFRADSGYVPRVDLRMLDNQWTYTFWGKPKGWFNQLLFWARGYRITDSTNRMTDSRLALGSSYMGPLQSEFTVIIRSNRERFAGTLYDVSDLYFYAGIKPCSGLSLGLEVNPAGAVDYENARAADALRIGPMLAAALGRHVNLSLSHNLERLSHGGGRIYTAHLFQAKLIYNFNVRSFVRAILQYRDLSRDPVQYVGDVEPRSRSLFGQFLFSYKLNPQTMLFLGYSDQWRGGREIDLQRWKRTFFLKIGYALGM